MDWSYSFGCDWRFFRPTRTESGVDSESLKRQNLLHITDDDFGVVRDEDGKKRYISHTDIFELFTNLKIRTNTSVESKMLMYELYESTYKIFDHLKPENRKKNPFHSISVHPTEENYKSSELRKAIEDYVLLNIKDITNLSLIEFLNLPREYVKMINEIAVEKSKKVSLELEELKKLKMNIK